MTDFPRLLVATEFSPNGVAGGGSGAVLRQMLKDWPAERLFWWSCFPERDEFFGRKVAVHRVALIPAKLYPNRRWRAQKAWLLDKIWAPWAFRHFNKTLEMLKPDALWVHPHCWAIPPLARALPDAGIGFHVSIHDYMNVRGMINRFGPARAKQMQSMAEQLYIRATTRDSICEAMAADLRARTGCDGAVNHAGLEQDDFDYLARAPEAKQNASIRVAYAGTIIAEQSFILFVKALAEIRHQFPLPLTLEFFGDHSYGSQHWFDSTWMKEHGSLNASRLSAALKECNWGFSPMDMTDNNPGYNRFSLPTKLVSYLAAGLPVIAMGHPESTVAKIASKYNIGLCMTDGDIEQLKAQLLAGLSEPDSKRKYHAEIQRCARMEFDAARMRAVLYENFRRGAAA